MHHTDGDDIEAAKKAVVLLDHSIYKDKMPDAGLYFAQTAAEGRRKLSALNTPRLGDSMLDSTGQTVADCHPEARSQAGSGQAGSESQLFRWAAGLRTDAWDDKVYTLKTTAPVLLNARDKMPFEVTPVYYKLSRYDQAGAEASTQQQSAQPNQASAQPAAPPPQQ